MDQCLKYYVDSADKANYDSYPQDVTRTWVVISPVDGLKLDGFWKKNSSYINGRYFADNIFKSIYLKENWCIFIKISLKFIPKDLFNNKSILVQIVAWRRTGDKQLSESLMQCPADAYMLRSSRMTYICES